MGRCADRAVRGPRASVALGSFFALGTTFTIVYGLVLIAALLEAGVSAALVSRRSGEAWRTALGRGCRHGLDWAASLFP